MTVRTALVILIFLSPCWRLGLLANNQLIRYAIILHGADSDNWWHPIRNAAQQAQEDFSVKVDIKNPPSGDLAYMARLVEQTAARNYHGVVTTIADLQVLKGSIAKITRKKIPLITINSGTQKQSEQLGAIMHVGQPEYLAGFKAGEKAKKSGINSYVCVNQFATNPISFERCRGFGDAIGVDFKKFTLDTGIDPTVVGRKFSAFIRKNPQIEAVLTLGVDSAAPVYRVLSQKGRLGKIYFASFDLSQTIVQGIEKDHIAFGIDQQLYLQGYIPIAVLSLMKQNQISRVSEIWEMMMKNPRVRSRFKKYGLLPQFDGKRHIHSGPYFVEKSNVALVKKHAGEYR